MEQNIIVHEVPTGAEPEGVFLTEDGKSLYVTSEVGDTCAWSMPMAATWCKTWWSAPPAPVRGDARRQGAVWVSRRSYVGEVYMIDRAKFAVSSKIEFLPPGMRKSDVTPVGLVMTKDGKTAYVTLGHAAHVAVVDVPTRKVQGYVLVGKRSWGVTLSRDEAKVRRQWLRR